MDNDSDSGEGVQNIQNANAFNDQMPLYPDDYYEKRTVSFMISILYACFFCLIPWLRMQAVFDKFVGQSRIMHFLPYTRFYGSRQNSLFIMISIH